MAPKEPTPTQEPEAKEPASNGTAQTTPAEGAPSAPPAAQPTQAAPSAPTNVAANEEDTNTGIEIVRPREANPPKGLDRATLREHRPSHQHESRRMHGHSKDDKSSGSTPKSKKGDDQQF